MKFEDLFESEDLLDALWDMHFDECTPIQEQAIPVILNGNDLLACAQTGTGKTAAYLLPVIDMICSGDYPQDRVNCVVMAPTRELAQQIDRQMQGFAYFMPISSLPIYGGTDGITYEQQRKGLKMGADVVIATPGRLKAHIQMGSVDLSEVSFLILDEADRMLDMGFYDDIMSIVSHMSGRRQTLLFSATMPAKIQQLANTILNNPAEIKLAVSKPAEKILQQVYYCMESQKEQLLSKILEGEEPHRVIVFVGSKQKVKELSRRVKLPGVRIGEMHSDLEQSSREQMMLDFKSGRINVLFATDIVARGIDIDDIEMVINYDVPHEAEDYVHRVGRTARANRDGKAVTLVSEKEVRRMRGIERVLGNKIKRAANPLGEPQIPPVKSGKPKQRRRHNKKPSNNEGKKRYNNSKDMEKKRDLK
ncbi:MAG: DEAD/DEAH box helicase [Muribaculaceae bacterium]|nr:DEAD/DEAH box helicase [Muribaculaceae bacterium]